MQREEPNSFRRVREVLAVLSAGGRPCAKLSPQQSDHTKITSCKTTTVGCNSRRDPVQNIQQNSGVPKKQEAERNELEKFWNSNSFVMWKMNFKSEVCSCFSFPTEAVVWINEIDSVRNMEGLKSAAIRRIFKSLLFPKFLSNSGPKFANVAVLSTSAKPVKMWEKGEERERRGRKGRRGWWCGGGVVWCCVVSCVCLYAA